ncbi:GNAT family N-acetyltransferase [Parasedimentitalea psychrophila]|uniref:GNAT family N-acetyltransferase n=1 Tax=Parasedimentitalea psychrophila TaxID=2997337 RepID=A0A9Y2KXU3_9RHOB|nr:GNAT family N-acetyltransferase [Parasedimentitalea psychrophila]WIY23847.1 GNAT family N-acetyltransferase [Parasedimentitalea psychrophila]
MADVTVRRFVAGDLHWLAARHQDLYARDEGVDATYGAMITALLHDFCSAHDPLREKGWIAAQRARRLGSIFCIRESDEIARLRLFLLTPQARGQGLGKRLIRDCMGFARQAGYRQMALHSYQSHRTSGSLYRAFGWQLVDSRPVFSFGANLIEQTWHVML